MDLQKGENGVLKIFNHIRTDRLESIKPITSLVYAEIESLGDFYLIRSHVELFIIEPNHDWEKTSTILYSIKFEEARQAESAKDILLRKLNAVAA